MREPTQATRSLIDALRALPKRRFGFARKRNAAAAELLWKIADAREPAALPEVLSLVLEDEPIARAASRAASVLLGAVPTAELPWLDERLRARATWWGGWWAMRPRDLNRFDRLGEAATALLQLATMHPSGFVREAAVRALSGRAEAAESLSFYLIRRNDWVEPVRCAAIEALDRSATAGNAEAIVEALPLVHRLETCSRADHGPFVARIRDLLVQPECGDALTRGIASPDAKVRRACFSLAFGSSAIAHDELMRMGLRDRDPIVRLAAARQAAGAQPDALAEWLDRMQHDPFTAVRQVGLDARIALFPEERTSAYERHLFDRSVSIRAQAQKGLERAGRSRSSLYRSELQSGETRRLDVAILGLSEVGSAADAALASGFLTHSRPRVRAAAVRAVARLSPDDLLPMLYVALGDESPRVSRAARTAFLAGAASPDGTVLRDILDRSQHRHTKLAVVSVARALPRWERLQFLLGACVSSDEELVARAVIGVDRWLDASNRAALSPTGEEIRETTRLLNEASGWLPEDTASEMAFLLRALSKSGF
jgi:hypothetical protein